MELKKSIKKIIAVGVGAIFIGATLTGCADISMTQKEYNDAIELAKTSDNEQIKTNAIASVDITSDNPGVIDAALNEAQIKADEQILTDYKKAQEDQETDDIKTAKKVTDSYLIDDISLTGNFADNIDSDDYEKLSYYEVELNNEDYAVEEKVYVSEYVRPVLNLKDFDGEIAVEIIDEGAFKYCVEFDDVPEFSEYESSSETLDFNLAGDKVSLSKWDEDTVTFTIGDEQTIEERESIVVDDYTVTVINIKDNYASFTVTITDEEGKSRSETGRVFEYESATLLELDISVEGINDFEVGEVDADGNPFIDSVTAKLGKDVTYSVTSGEDYSDDNDEWKWDIEGESICLETQDTYEDDDEVLKVGDSISLPNGYISFVIDPIKNMDLTELQLKVSRTKLTLDYDGKIEVDGDKVDNGKIIIYDDEGLVFDYRYKVDKIEGNTNFDDIVIINGDRELNIELDEDEISITGEFEYGYVYSYAFGDEYQFTGTTGITEEINDDDDYRVDNGDLLYKSDINEEDDKETTVKLGLVSDEEVELTLRVE